MSDILPIVTNNGDAIFRTSINVWTDNNKTATDYCYWSNAVTNTAGKVDDLYEALATNGLVTLQGFSDAVSNCVEVAINQLTVGQLQVLVQAIPYINNMIASNLGL